MGVKLEPSVVGKSMLQALDDMQAQPKYDDIQVQVVDQRPMQHMPHMVVEQTAYDRLVVVSLIVSSASSMNGFFLGYQKSHSCHLPSPFENLQEISWHYCWRFRH